MKAPTQNERLFKENVEKLMAKYQVGFRVVVAPVGKLSRFVHWLTKSFYKLDSSVLIQSNGPQEPIRPKK